MLLIKHLLSLREGHLQESKAERTKRRQIEGNNKDRKFNYTICDASRIYENLVIASHPYSILYPTSAG